MPEITTYSLLAAVVAGTLLIAGGQPWWYAVAVLGATVSLLCVLAYVARRMNKRPGSADLEADPEPAEHSRRRRRHKR